MSVAAVKEANQYLTFKLAEEVFAVDVSSVREILEMIPITKVPKTPEFMRGVINVRGSVVPVVDMRLKFSMPRGEETVNTCIIVMEVYLDGEATTVGALTDSVQEVFELSAEQIEPAPKIGTQLDTEFIKGIGNHDDSFVIILDIDRIFTSEELAIVREAGGAAPEDTGEVRETPHVKKSSKVKRK
jgi:purine-binding chemotaxis protein CheW